MLGTGKDYVFAHVSSNKYGVRDILEIWSSPLVRYNKKQNEGSWTTLEETRPDHAIRSAVAVTKLPLKEEEKKEKKKKKNNKKEKFDFLKIFFLWIFFNYQA